MTGYRLMVIYEITGTDVDDAETKKDKLDAAAQRLDIPRGFVDNAGPVG